MRALSSVGRRRTYRKIDRSRQMIGGEFSRDNAHQQRPRLPPRAYGVGCRAEHPGSYSAAARGSRRDCHLLAGKRTVLGKPLLQSADHEPAVDAESRELLAVSRNCDCRCRNKRMARLPARLNGFFRKSGKRTRVALGNTPVSVSAGSRTSSRHLVGIEASLLFVQQRRHLFGRNPARRAETARRKHVSFRSGSSVRPSVVTVGRKIAASSRVWRSDCCLSTDSSCPPATGRPGRSRRSPRARRYGRPGPSRTHRAGTHAD